MIVRNPPSRSGPYVSSIVIIEEDPLMRDLLVEWLGAEGYSVRAAAAGEVRVAPSRPDLLVVDVYMPRREGAKSLRDVRAAHPDTPLIAISGQFRPGLAGACSAADELGVEQVIAKPFSRRDLLAAVRSAIGRAG
jgi:CheY-like chemotaxis protein